MMLKAAHRRTFSFSAPVKKYLARKTRVVVVTVAVCSLLALLIFSVLGIPQATWLVLGASTLSCILIVPGNILVLYYLESPKFWDKGLSWKEADELIFVYNQHMGLPELRNLGEIQLRTYLHRLQKPRSLT